MPLTPELKELADIRRLALLTLWTAHHCPQLRGYEAISFLGQHLRRIAKAPSQELFNQAAEWARKNINSFLVEGELKNAQRHFLRTMSDEELVAEELAAPAATTSATGKVA